MHLMNILSLRNKPAAGVFMAITRRCPLSCSHCSTNSLKTSEQHAEDIFLKFIKTFSPFSRPDLVLFTGGEPLLRANLVIDLVNMSHLVGAKTSLISGMFFALKPKIPPLINQTIKLVDHFTASMDYFHEQEVPRDKVFNALNAILDLGKDVSIQLTALEEKDPYLLKLVEDIRRYFNDQVPILCSKVGSAGRAKLWVTKQKQCETIYNLPISCNMAAWPVITFNGNIVACCNQTVVDGNVPEHLSLGHVNTTNWSTISEKTRKNVMLRAIRLLGPQYIQQNYSSTKSCNSDYCGSCHLLSKDTEVFAKIESMFNRHTMHFIEEQNTGSKQQQVYGMPGYEHLAKLGYKGEI